LFRAYAIERRFTNLGVGFYQVRADSGDCNEVSAVVEITELRD
jgi:hypothetical protein